MRTPSRQQTAIAISICVLGTVAAGLRVTGPSEPPLIPEGLLASNAETRREAAEALARTFDPGLVPALRARIASEPDFHVQLALHYALTAKGERTALRYLIDSLAHTSHMGANYLGWDAPINYGWDRERYLDWYHQTSDNEYREFIVRRWATQPMLNEWGEFAGAFARRDFAGMNSQLEEPFNSQLESTDKDRQILAESPTSKAWELFEQALSKLQSEGDRPAAARLFHQVVLQYPRTYYAADARELAYLLDRMVLEDRNHSPPRNLSQLSPTEVIEFHIFNLRDLQAYQWTQPGECSVLGLAWNEDGYNAAEALRDIGRPAVPALVALLDDRRPVRGVGFWRDFRPTRTVLRYQDAAIEILEAILASDVYRRQSTAAYFSEESAEVRAAAKSKVRELVSRVGPVFPATGEVTD